jgi:integrase/recombinase XerD
MIQVHPEIKLVPRQLQEALAGTKNLKYRVIILLMLDCGLRVTEVVKLQRKHFNFMQNTVTVTSLKKRSTRLKTRTIPLSARLLEAVSDYWSKVKAPEADAYLFPGAKGSKELYMSRVVVWKRIKKYSNGVVHPHMLRHTFATRVVREGNDIRVAQKLLGHNSQLTTEIYLHVEDQELRQAIHSIDTSSWLQRLQRRIFPPKRVHLMPLEKGLTKYHVGRKQEIAKLMELAEKQVNVILLGAQGIGKTHLLDNYKQGKILRVDDVSYPKKMLAGMLLHLFQDDKEAIAKAMFEMKDIQQVITKESAKRLVELLIQITKPKEYTIIFDDLTNITRAQVSYLEKLKNHFHILAAARQVKVEHSSFITNFEKLEIKPLTRPETLELIAKVSLPYLSRIEDYEGFKNHIWDQTGGNPLFALEMLERYEKEAFVSSEQTREIRHTAAQKEIDMMLPFVIGLSALMILRYAGGELGDDSGAYRLIGGVFLVFALFARNIYKMVRRKFI